MENTASKTIRSLKMLSPRDRVLVALSGGPDSASLLYFLHGLKKNKIFAVHVNHMLRGSESDGDASFVKGFCRRLGIPLAVVKRDVKALAKSKKMSIEEAGRAVRYKVFEDAARSFNADKIALAHNADDNVETFIMRLMHGTGIRGLCGIPPVRGRIIRPFIDTWKKDILEYCRKRRVPYRTDRSNLNTEFTRNKIRNMIIPALEKEQPGLKNKVFKYIKAFSKDYDLLQEEIVKLSRKILKKTSDGIVIDREGLFKLSDGLRGLMVREAIERFHGSLLNIDEVHTSNILSLERGYIHLPNGLFAAADSGSILITKKKPQTEKTRNFNLKLKIPGDLKLPDHGISISAAYVKCPRNIRTISRAEALLDADKVKGPLSVRNFKAGDWFIPLGMKGRKKLQDFFVDLKVPVQERPLIPIVCDREKILWITGYRPDERAKLDTGTTRAIKLLVHPREDKVVGRNPV